MTYRRVYQGGHHDVWCDGATHKRTTGGFVWPDNKEPARPISDDSKCDCAYWRGAELPMEEKPI